MANKCTFTAFQAKIVNKRLAERQNKHNLRASKGILRHENLINSRDDILMKQQELEKSVVNDILKSYNDGLNKYKESL